MLLPLHCCTRCQKTLKQTEVPVFTSIFSKKPFFLFRKKQENNEVANVQDDGHIFCLPDQIAPEIRGVLDMVEHVMGALGFTQLEINLSTKPAKAVGSPEIWEKAEAALREALRLKGWDYKIDEGGGAFYGPKIDVKIQDVLGRKWQCSTIQLDFNLPERFQMVTHVKGP